jgi:2,3-bisphosphoglycerate-independent phosphoglycerate mutase
MDKKALLIILDGWGIAPEGGGNAVTLAKTPNMDSYFKKYPNTLLSASGVAVGLPEGQIGNSEVGHFNIGAGRVVLEDLPRINKAIENKTFFRNKALSGAFEYAKRNNKPLHLIGLVSPGGVHSHQNHLYALLEMAKKYDLRKVYIHVITDGRDVDPKSAVEYVLSLDKKIKKIGIGEIATICGRYYVMDRDNRWNRTEKAYDMLVLGKGILKTSPKEAILDSYKNGITDEFVLPTIINKEGLISDNDALIFFNLRSDRPREITKALIEKNFSSFLRKKVLENLYFVTMTEYEKDLPIKAIAFEPEMIENCLSEVISKQGLSQLHIAETEKYAHVTFFFNGGRERPFYREDRVLIPSPQVATYDLEPKMSAEAVCRSVLNGLGRFNFIVVNFANPDMVGHTGDLAATIKACEEVDFCLGKIVALAESLNYEIIIIADHGNAEQMKSEDETPSTSHTTNKVPFIYIGKNYEIRDIIGPKLGNIAPTILDLMSIEKPKEMTENSLLDRIL